MTKQERELRDRIKAVKAMEFMARQVNDENVFDMWLMCGVADEDIKYGDLAIQDNVEEDPAYDYASDPDTFSALMEVFLRTMMGAYESGGLWCGNVLSDK